MDKVVIQNLAFSFPGSTFGIQVDRLAVGAGRVLGIIGPNGAGKTSLLNLIALFERPTAGSLHVLGHNMLDGSANLLAVRREMSYTLSQPPLLNDTVFNNARLPLLLRGTKDMRPVDEVLALVGMDAMKDRDVRTLSQGQRSRVALARALVTRPSLLLLDEPFAHLDVPHRDAMTGAMRDMTRRTGTSVVFVTQNFDEALAFSDDLAVMIDGRIHQCAPPSEVFTRPASNAVALFVGAGTVLDGIIDHANDGLVEVVVGSHRIEAVASYAVGDHVALCIRPEAITLDVARQSVGETATSARNHIKGTIARIEDLPLDCMVTVDCGFMLAATVTRQSVVRLGLAPGREVVASFKASAVHVVRRGGTDSLTM